MATATQEVLATPDDEEDDDGSRLARIKMHAALAAAQGLAPDIVPFGCAPALAGVLVAVRDEDTGPWTTLHADLGQMVIAGEAIDVATAGPRLVALRTTRGVAFVDLARGALLAAFAVDASAPLPMAADSEAAIVHHGESLVIMYAGGNITRLPLPQPPRESYAARVPPRARCADDEGAPAALAVTPGSFVIAAGGRRVTIARASVAQGPPGLITFDALAIDPLPGARSDDEQCVVRSSVAEYVSLTHLRENRPFNHTVSTREEAATFKKGERVYVVGPGGSPGSLLKASEAPPGFGAPAPVWLDPAELPPLEPFSMPSSADAASFAGGASGELGIASLVEATGLRPSSLLSRFAWRHDADRFFREAAWRLMGTFIPSLDPIALGLPIDPCLFCLSDEESGDYYAFYDYPPARAAGQAVVRYLHDEDAIVFVAPSFDDFLANRLGEGLEAEEDDASALCLLRLIRMLALPVTLLDAGAASDPPPWFEAAHPRQARGAAYRPPDPAAHLRRGDEARARGDWLTAERAYVRALHESAYGRPERRPIAARLAEAYAALGWPLHARRMRES